MQRTYSRLSDVLETSIAIHYGSMYAMESYGLCGYGVWKENIIMFMDLLLEADWEEWEVV